MISTRLAATVAAGVLVVGILVGSAGAVLLGGPGPRGSDWGPGANGMMGGAGHGMMGGSMMGGSMMGGSMMGGSMMGGSMMGGSWDYDEMLDEMREHMGWPATSRDASGGDGQ